MNLVGCVEGFVPERGRNLGVLKHGSDHIEERSMKAFNHAIGLRRIASGSFMNNATGVEV